MQKKMITICLAAVLACVVLAADKGKTAGKKSYLVVGVFDSRAVACAWIRSKANMQNINEIQAEYKKAKASGDEERMDQLVEQQAITHKQVFGNEPIDDVLERIKKDLPKIASDAGVDILVSKWEIAYKNKNAKFVDVTWEMANLFEPDQATVKVIKEILVAEPIPADQLKYDH